MVLRLDLGHIRSNPVENTFATLQLALLATKITFYDLFARTCAENKFLRRTSLGFSIFEFFPLPFFSFSFLFVAVIDLLLGCVRLKNFKKESWRWQIFTMEQLRVVAGNIALSFSLIFFSIIVHISGSIRPFTVI